MKADIYETSDSLWTRVTDYTSAVWDSWGKDVDEYIEDVMDTDSRSDDELYASTVLQDSAHSVELVAHLVGSVLSNDYTKERVKELGTDIASTENYQDAKESLDALESQLSQASKDFMQEHPQFNDAYMRSEAKVEAFTSYVTKEAQTFADNHPEITHNIQSVVEIAAVVPAVKAVKIANHATQSISTVNTLGYLDKAQKHPVEFSTPTGEDLKAWQKIVRPEKKIDLDSSQAVLNTDTNAPSWMWDKSFSIVGVKESIQTKSLEPLAFNVGIQGAEKLAKVLGQKPEFVQISTEGKPLGMMLMVKDYKNHVTDENSGFVWYLESAPKGYVDKVLDIDRNEFDIKPGAALLDTASVKSLEAGRNDVMLHADPHGGDGLMTYYVNQK